jgi:hypothetical protein
MEDLDYQGKINARKSEIRNSDNTEDVYPLVQFHMEQGLKHLEDAAEMMTHACGGRMWASEFAKAYAELRHIKEGMEQREYAVNLLLETFGQLLADQYEAEGITNLKIEGLGAVRVQVEPHANVSDREAYRLWCIEQGLERQMSLAWQTTNALLKDRLLKGESAPPGVTAESKNKIVFTKE